MIFMYIVHCAVVYEYEMIVYISWKIVGLLYGGCGGMSVIHYSK